MARILVVDDDKNICELLRLYLEQDQHEIIFAHDGSSALNLFREREPQLVLLDLMLPLISGIEVCRLMRRESMVPILMLTARDSSDDKVTGLDVGADDYVVKPFDPQEVAARVRALLRRPSTEKANRRDESIIIIDDLTINMQRYEVCYRGNKVEMKPKEIQLLHFLATNRNRVFTREELLDKVWGYEFAGGTRTVDVHIKRIREKFEQPGSNWEIKTVWGVGYKLEVTHG
ncbi:MAG: response regulator [Methylocystaceae bacterium]